MEPIKIKCWAIISRDWHFEEIWIKGVYFTEQEAKENFDTDGSGDDYKILETYFTSKVFKTFVEEDEEYNEEEYERRIFKLPGRY